MGDCSADAARKDEVDAGLAQPYHSPASRSQSDSRDNGNGMFSSNTPLTGRNEQDRNKWMGLDHMASQQHARTKADFSLSRNRKRHLRAIQVASWS